jgi:hypothetical protein
MWQEAETEKSSSVSGAVVSERTTLRRLVWKLYIKSENLALTVLLVLDKSRGHQQELCLAHPQTFKFNIHPKSPPHDSHLWLPFIKPQLQTTWFNHFDVCKSAHHYTIQINQPTRYDSFTSLLLDVQMLLNMFRVSPRPSSGAYNCTGSLWFYR